MKIKMLKDMSGNATRIYKNNEIIDCDADWKVEIGKNFVNNNFAIEVKIDTPKETKKKIVKKKTTKKAK